VQTSQSSEKSTTSLFKKDSTYIPMYVHTSQCRHQNYRWSKGLQNEIVGFIWHLMTATQVARWQQKCIRLCLVRLIGNFNIIVPTVCMSTFWLTTNKFSVFQTVRQIWREKVSDTSLFVKMTDKNRRLFEKLESVQESCGQVCDASIEGRPGKVIVDFDHCDQGPML
jgi:hypothetical protein